MTISTWAPQARIITNITQANPGVVTTSQPHGYFDKLFVRIDLGGTPRTFGMYQVANQVYSITVLAPTTFSINTDTSAFDAFVYSTNPQSPQCIPGGEEASTLKNAEHNTLTPTGGLQ
jgi:hypothetical protein